MKIRGINIQVNVENSARKIVKQRETVENKGGEIYVNFPQGDVN